MPPTHRCNFIPSVQASNISRFAQTINILFAASSSLPCQHGIDRCLLPGGRLTDSIAVPSLAPDPTVTLIAQDDLHLWLQTPLAWIISSPCNRVRASHRTCTPRFSATADANDPPAISAQRARRQLCLLLSLAVACRALPLLPSHRLPLAASAKAQWTRSSCSSPRCRRTRSIRLRTWRTRRTATGRSTALGSASSPCDTEHLALEVVQRFHTIVRAHEGAICVGDDGRRLGWAVELGECSGRVFRAVCRPAVPHTQGAFRGTSRVVQTPESHVLCLVL